MQDFVRGWIPCVGDQSRKQFPLFEPRAEMPGRRARRDGSREREEAGLEEFIGKIRWKNSPGNRKHLLENGKYRSGICAAATCTIPVKVFSCGAKGGNYEKSYN